MIECIELAKIEIINHKEQIKEWKRNILELPEGVYLVERTNYEVNYETETKRA